MSSRPVFSVAGVLILCACGNLGLSGEPEALTVDLESVGASHLTLVTSTDWIFTQDPACDPSGPGCPEVLRVLAADTATVGSPHRRTLRFGDELKYLIEVFPAGGVTATVEMRVDIDGKEWFNERRELRPNGANGQETLQFVYQWREPTLR